MYEFTKKIKSTESKCIKREKAEVSKVKTSFKYFIRIVSVFLIYFLLKNDYSVFNCIACIVLMFYTLYDVMVDEN